MVGARPVAGRGTTLRCRGWRQEALLRMLENNLENGERPEDLVVYASFAKAARDWASYHAIVAALRDLRETRPWSCNRASPSASFRPTTGHPWC